MEVEITKHVEFTVRVTGSIDNEGYVSELKMTHQPLPGTDINRIPLALWSDLVDECADELRAEAVRRIREDGE